MKSGTALIELHGNLIDGAWDTKGTAQADINPSDLEDIVGQYVHARPAQVDAAVLAACAEPVPGRADTWINPVIAAAYGELYRRGQAHSGQVLVTVRRDAILQAQCLQ